MTESGPQQWRWMNFDGGTTAGANVTANKLWVTEIVGKGITGGEWPTFAIIDDSVDAWFNASTPSGNRLSVVMFARAQNGVLSSADLSIDYRTSTGTPLCSFNDRLDAAELLSTDIDFDTGAVSFSAIPCDGADPQLASVSMVPGEEFWRLNGWQVNSDGTRTNVKQNKYYTTATGTIGATGFVVDNGDIEVGRRVTR